MTGYRKLRRDRALVVVPWVLICLALSGGCSSAERKPQELSSALREEVDEELLRVEHLRTLVKQGREAVRAAATGEPALPKGHPALKNATGALARVETGLAALEGGALPQLKKLLKRDRQKDAERIKALRNEVRAARNQLAGGLATARKELSLQLGAKKALSRLAPRVRAAVKGLPGIPLPTLPREVAKHRKAFPVPGARLAKELAMLNARARALRKVASAYDEARRKGPVDFRDTVQKARHLLKESAAVERSIRALSHRVAGLGVTEDWILVDRMKERGGYYHRYVRVRGKVLIEDKAWTLVKPSAFKAHKENIGMCVLHKPRGVLPEDAPRVVPAPPGFHHVGKPGLGRWRASKWGTRFWVWDPMHASVEKAFYGPHEAHLTILWDLYDAYLRSRKANRPFYGRDSAGRRIFGSGGEWTGLHYRKWVVAAQKRILGRLKKRTDKLVKRLNTMENQRKDAGVYKGDAPPSSASSGDSGGSSWGGFRTGSGRTRWGRSSSSRSSFGK